MKKLVTAATLLLACHAVRAGTPNAATVATAPASGEAASAYSPKTKSVFTGSVDAHNPFWPIGWVKTEAIAGSDDSAPTIPRPEDFTVSTILLNDPPMAVINGKDLAEGEIAAFSVNGQPVVVQLMAVQDGRVILRWQNQNIVVPIHRQEDLTQVDNPQ